MNESDNIQPAQSELKPWNRLGIIGFAAVGIGVLILEVFSGLPGIVAKFVFELLGAFICIVALINARKKRLRGNWMAILGIIIFVLDIAISVLGFLAFKSLADLL